MNMRNKFKIKKKYIVYSLMIIIQLITAYILTSIRPEGVTAAPPDTLATSLLFTTIAIMLIREAKNVPSKKIPLLPGGSLGGFMKFFAFLWILMAVFFSISSLTGTL